MEFYRKITNWGESLGLTVPKEIAQLQSLNPGDIVKVSISKNFERKIKNYKCLYCLYEFPLEEGKEEVYCPSCNNEDINGIVEIE